MEYLYNITIEFYQQLLDCCQKHNLDYSTITNNSENSKEIERIVNNILNGYTNYFQQFSKFFTLSVFDYDFIASHMEKFIYIVVANNKNKTGNYQVVNDYHEYHRQELTKIVQETFMMRKIMFMFLSKMRMYYLDDFMRRSNQADSEGNQLHILYSKLSLMNDRTGLKKYATYEEMIDAVSNRYMEIEDLIAKIIDSPLFIDDIIKQQEYYISEIDRLERTILERGNITKLPTELFNIYINFLETFKEKAHLRIASLQEQKNKKISTFIFN